MQNKQPEAFGYAYCLESRGFEAEATLLRTQHEAIERKDALLRRVLGLFDITDVERVEELLSEKDVVLATIKQEISQ